MKKVVIFGALTALVFLIAPATPAQDADEVAKLRRENELLKRENELLKQEIVVLKQGRNAKPDEAAGLKTGAKDLDLLQGTWNIDSMEWGGKGLPKELMTGYKFVFDGNKLSWEGAIGIQSRSGKVSALDDTVHPCAFKIDPGQDPRQIDITIQLKRGDRDLLGIYEMKGDTLKVCYGVGNTGRRPTEFATKDVNIGLIVLTRAKK